MGNLLKVLIAVPVPLVAVVVVVGLGLLVWVYSVLYPALRRKTNLHPEHWLRVRRGAGFGVPELALRLGLSEEELGNIDVSYRTQWVPKRRGGTRRLEIPSASLKDVQRRILRRLLARLRTHQAVTGFEPGRSIVDNAAAHVGQAVVINVDIRDFFTSTTANRVDDYFRRIGWNRDAAALLTRLTTSDGGLPQGAPTSPRLSNLLNMRLDARIDRFVRRRRGTYTRYADDITISFPADYPRKVRGTIQQVRRQLKSHGYQMHPDKLRVLRSHQQQKVTGLVVNEKVNLPRSVRRKLRAIEHHHRTGRPATLTSAQLRGWQAFRRMIEHQS